MSQRPAEEKMDVDGEEQLPATSSSSLVAGIVPVAGSQTVLAKSQPESRNVMAGSATVPSVTCSLHPLVIMNISDHWTRIRAQKGFKFQVFGALIGKQKGRNIEIMNSFELKFDVIDEEVHILMDYYNVKEQQCKYNFIIDTVRFTHSVRL